MSLLADQRKQELLESVRTVSQHMQRGEFGMEARNYSSDWDYQDALHGADILESAAGEDFLRDEEEALLADGCSLLVEPEDFWSALNRSQMVGRFGQIKAAVITQIMDGEKFRQAARDHLEAEAKKRMEP